MPRILELKNCPHCGEALPKPAPRVCPACGGSLQQRYLKAGCISAGPAVFMVWLGIDWLVKLAL